LRRELMIYDTCGHLAPCLRSSCKDFYTTNIHGEHINVDGEFQSDKYPWCQPGFVPLKLTDPMAQPVLWHYAALRASVDAAFADDLRMALRAKGYDPDGS